MSIYIIKTHTTLLVFYIYPQIYYFWNFLFLCENGLWKSKDMDNNKMFAKHPFFLFFSFSFSSKNVSSSFPWCSLRGASLRSANLQGMLCGSVCLIRSLVMRINAAISHSQRRSPMAGVANTFQECTFQKLCTFRLASPVSSSPWGEVWQDEMGRMLGLPCPCSFLSCCSASSSHAVPGPDSAWDPDCLPAASLLWAQPTSRTCPPPPTEEAR